MGTVLRRLRRIMEVVEVGIIEQAGVLAAVGGKAF